MYSLPANIPNDKTYCLHFNWHLKNLYFELLKIVQQKNYDNIFNKVPVLVFPNWSQIVNDLPNLNNELCLKLIFDFHLPDIKINGTICKEINKNNINYFSESKNQSNNCLNINISKIDIITVLGIFLKVFLKINEYFRQIDKRSS